MRRAYLVVGGESTGTRLATKLLLAAGCVGDAGHEQRWDTALPDVETPIVWRRSFPHAGAWPNLVEMVAALKSRDYAVQVVVTTRDWWAAAQSQKLRGHVVDAALAVCNLQMAYLLIFDGLTEAGVDYLLVGYEGLVQRPEIMTRWLCDRLGLEAPSALPFEIYDGNAAYVVRIA